MPYQLPRGAGRPVGAQNKISVVLRTAVLESFERLGGVAYLEAVGRQDPKTYCTLLSKLLPKAEPKTEPVTATLTDHALNDRLAALLRDSGVSREAVSTGDSVDAEVVSVLRSPTE